MHHKIKFDQFLSAACKNDLMDGLVDNQNKDELPQQ